MKSIKQQRRIQLGLMIFALAGGSILFLVLGVWTHCSALPAACGG